MNCRRISISFITYTYEAVDSTGTVWPMSVTLNFTIKEEHTHSYGTTYSSDANNHWNTCNCGAKDNVTAHDFEWIVDKLATESATGTKHEECSVCGYEKDAVEIPKLESDDEEYVAPVQGDVKDDVPKTGDSFVMIVVVWGSIALLSGAGLFIFGKKRVNSR